MNLAACWINDNDIKYLSVKTSEVLTALESLVLHVSDLETSETMTQAWKTLFHEGLANVKILTLYEVSKQEYRGIASAINLGKLPSLRKLGIFMKEGYDARLNRSATYVRMRRYDVQKLNTINAPTLTDLILQQFVCSRTHLAKVALSAKKSVLNKLDISHAHGITGNLSILLSEGFPAMNTLILNDCGLNSQDLTSLVETSREGRLPQLTNLDLSDNPLCVDNIDHFFSQGHKWSHLLTLNVKQDVESNEDFQALVVPVQSGALVNLQHLILSTNNVSYLPNCMNVTWPSVRFLHVYCACRRGTSDHIRLFEQVSKAVKGKYFPFLETLNVTSQFVFKDVDPVQSFQSFMDIMSGVTVKEQLNELERSSSSLLTTSLSSQTDPSYQKHLQGLTRIKGIFGKNSNEEYSVLLHFINKVALIMYPTGTLPDLKTTSSLLHEAIDNAPDMPDFLRPFCKVLGDAVCTNFYSWFYGRSFDWQQVCKAVFEWAEKYFDLGLDQSDLSALISLTDLIPSLYWGHKDGFEAAFRVIDEWIEKTSFLSDQERFQAEHIKIIAQREVMWAFENRPIDLQPIGSFLYDLIQLDPSLSETDRLSWKYLVDILCLSLESIVNTRPINLQPVITRLHEWMASSQGVQSLPPTYRTFLELGAEFVSVFVQCILNNQFNFKPLHDLVYQWIDNSTISDSDRPKCKSYLDDCFTGMKTLMRKRSSILDVLPSSTDPIDTSFSMRAQRFNDKWGRGSTVSELRVLIHGLRKLGIKVYMRHTTRDQQLV